MCSGRNFRRRRHAAPDQVGVWARPDFFVRRLLTSAAYLLSPVKAGVYERTLPHRFDRVIIAKSDDRRFFPGRLCGLAIVPNGVRVSPAVIRRTSNQINLMIVGTLAYSPNQDTVCFFAREVLTLLRAEHSDATLDLVGRGPAPRVLVDALKDRRCRLQALAQEKALVGTSLAPDAQCR